MSGRPIADDRGREALGLGEHERARLRHGTVDGRAGGAGVAAATEPRRSTRSRPPRRASSGR